MHRSLPLVFLLIAAAFATAHAQEWTYRYDGGSSAIDEAADAVIVNGNTYIAGSSFSAATGWDIAVCAIASDGSKQWENKIVLPGDQKAVRILANTAGIVVAGHGEGGGAASGGVFHRMNLDGSNLVSGGFALESGRLFARLVDVRSIGASSFAVLVNGVDSTDRHKVFLLMYEGTQQKWIRGYVYGSDAWGDKLFSIGNTIGILGHRAGNTVDGFMTIYDLNGNELASQPYDNGDDEYPMDAVNDASGNLFIAGYWDDRFGMHSPGFLKVDPSGFLVYSKNIPSTGNPGSRAIQLKLDSNGDPVILVRERKNDGYRMLAAKYTSDGDFEWSAEIAGEGNGADTEPPMFKGLSAAELDGSSARLFWYPATDDQSMHDEIVYSVYMSDTSGGQDFNSPAGMVSGRTYFRTPALAAGKTYYFVVRANDPSNNRETNTRELSVTTAAEPVEIATASLPGGVVGVAYSAQLQAQKGMPPYAWSLISGALPPGVTLDGGGTFAGTPNAAGSFQFTVRVDDSQSGFAEKALTIDVTDNMPSLIVLRDTTIGGGTLNFRRIIVGAGAVLTVTADAVLNAADSISVSGAIQSDCHHLTLASPLVMVAGSLDNSCSDTDAVSPGNLTIFASSGMLLGDTTKAPDQSLIETDGVLLLTDKQDVTPSDFIVPPLLRSPAKLPPVCAVSAGALNESLNSEEPLTVQFAIEGADPDGGAVTFDVDFGDGETQSNVVPEDGISTVLEHTFSTPGAYQVIVTVRDDESASSQSSLRLVVRNDSVGAPKALGLSIAATQLLNQHEDTVRFFAETGLDPASDIATYQWDLGDGTLSGDPSPVHVYAASGRYDISLTATDDSGHTATATTSIYVFETQTISGVRGTGLSKAALPAPPGWNPPVIWWARARAQHFRGWSGQNTWIPGWVEAKDGKAGRNGLSGRRGGNTDIYVEGDLDIRNPFGGNPNIRAGNGGNGGDGRAGRNSSAGAPGGKGGSLRIRAVNTNIVGGTFSTGNGGDGGSATAICNAGKDAHARGAAGGPPGSTLSILGSKSCSFQGNVSIILGKGGDGGSATAVACGGKNMCPAGEKGGSAYAYGGRGNGSPKSGIVLGNPTGLTNITISGGDGGKGGDATATAGKGGDAVCDNNATGGNGGNALAVGGNGGKTGYTASARARAMNVAPGSFKGGDGGNATVSGGNGGIGTANPNPAQQPNGCEIKGVDTHAKGGKGGTLTAKNGEYGTSKVNGASNDGQPGSNTLSGANGGTATATGGNGSNATECCPGGEGGKATTVGGEKGEHKPKPQKGGAVNDMPAVPGDAVSKGGKGGNSGPCCTPPSPGMKGATGGGSDATAQAEATYTSTGGDGGNGGDGKGPGGGGDGGTATGTVNGTKTDGKPGAPGNPCTITSKVYLHFSFPIGPVNPGPYTVPLYRAKTGDPQDLFGNISITVNGMVQSEGSFLFLGPGAEIYIEATSLTGGNPPVAWPTWYPIDAQITATQANNSPTAQLTFRGGRNAIQVASGSGSDPTGAPFMIFLDAANSPDKRFDHFYISALGEFTMSDYSIEITFEDP